MNFFQVIGRRWGRSNKYKIIPYTNIIPLRVFVNGLLEKFNFEKSSNRIILDFIPQKYSTILIEGVHNGKSKKN